MSESPFVMVVILNWNGEQDTIEAVRSVRGLDYPQLATVRSAGLSPSSPDQSPDSPQPQTVQAVRSAGLSPSSPDRGSDCPQRRAEARTTYCQLQTVVVDNGSRPESPAAIHAAFPDLECVETGRNLGYAGGNNIGLRLAMERGAEFCLILNNDVTVDPGMLRALVDAAQGDPAAAVLGPRVYRYDKPTELFYTGWKIDWRRWLFHRVPADLSDAPLLDVDFVQGCALMVRTSFVREHGMFDERFFLYCEDADLCVRARKAGLRTVEVPAARVWHKGYGSSGRQSPLKAYYGLRNRLLFIAKHAPPENQLRLRAHLLIFDAGGQALRACAGLCGGNWREAWLTLWALGGAVADWVAGRYGPGPDWLLRR